MMEAVLSRLEAVAYRLEQTEARLVGGGSAAVSRSSPVPARPAPAAPAAAAAPAGGDSAAAYQQQVMPLVTKLLETTEPIGGEVLKASRLVAAGFEKEGAVVQAIAQCQKPSDLELQTLVGPVGEQMVAASGLTGGPRSKYDHHFKLVAEAMQALSWVVHTGPACGMPPPAQHVQDAWAAAEFYGNKVIMEWRGKDLGAQHAAWVGAMKELVLGLKDYCKSYHPATVSWNASGIPLSQFKPGAAAAPAAAPAAGPAAAAAPAPAPAAKPAGGPPPPPPPMPAGGPGSLIEKQQAAAGADKPAAPAGGNMSALFAEINKGEGVTAGLKKVTADMKTKNRTDRSGTVPAGPAKAAPKAGGSAAAALGPPRIECEQDRKWVVENQSGNREIVIEDTNPRQTVYIYNCHNSTIQVKGKVNAISLDKCRRTGLVFESVVAVCEVVNCSSVEVQCTGHVPTVAVDKCDGCQIYLSRESLGADITTAKSSEVNVVVPGETEEADPLESAIPEQFVTRFRNGAWVTEPVSHSGG